MILGAAGDGFAASPVEWSILKTLQLEQTPIDVAVAPDGRRMFVLTEQGEIVIYSATTQVEGKIDVGSHVDHIKVGPGGNTLILSSRENKTVEIINFDFIRKINVSGAPWKGPEDAPVVIAVFSDFQ
jgi:DNA-binding beta-propeller fold protein YncE